MIKRFPPGLAALIVLVIAAVGAWTGYWYWAQGNVREAMGQFITDEAANGRVWSCAKADHAGFPFRFEGTCEQAVLQFPTQQGIRIARFARIEAVAMAWNPGHVILRAEGPATIADEGGQPFAQFNWSLAKSSVQFTTDGFDTISLVMEGAKASGFGTNLVLPRLDVHLRTSGTSQRDVDLVAKAEDATFTAPLVPQKPYTIELQASAREALMFPRQPILRRLNDWQAAGGALDLVLLKLSQKDALLAANGKIALRNDGRPQGRLDLGITGTETWVNDAGLGALGGPLLQAASLFARDTTIDGKPAKSYPLLFDDGRMRIGPLARPMPPLF
jgi:hypothetical protein